jgi:hypothetical protein
MSKRMNKLLPTELEQQAYAQANRQFADYLEQFQLSRKAVERIEQNLAKLALAANLAASRPSNNVIQADDGASWHKNVKLMKNIYLCHRPIEHWTEYAAVEHFPAHHTNEIWNRGQDAVQVLMVFAKEQRQALEIWSADLSAQVGKYLAEKYSSQDMGWVAYRFMRRRIHVVSAQSSQQPEQNRSFACA